MMTARYGRSYDSPTVPANDEAKYRDWKRRDQWKRRAGQDAFDRSGIRCEDKPSCPCPICAEFGKMRAEAHHFHYIRGVDWPEAWRAAGWTGDGNAETPFCNPGEGVTGRPSRIIVESNPAPRGWVADRFAEIDYLPSPEPQIESACAPTRDMPDTDPYARMTEYLIARKA